MEDAVKIVDPFGDIDIEIGASGRKWINQYAGDCLKYSSTFDGYSQDTSLSESRSVHMNGLPVKTFCRGRYTDSGFGRALRAIGIACSDGKGAEHGATAPVYPRRTDFPRRVYGGRFGHTAHFGCGGRVFSSVPLAGSVEKSRRGGLPGVFRVSAAANFSLRSMGYGMRADTDTGQGESSLARREMLHYGSS